MYEVDLTLNNLQWLMCQKKKLNEIQLRVIVMKKYSTFPKLQKWSLTIRLVKYQSQDT